MRIRRLRLEHYRSYRFADLPFTEERTVIVGPNASGKSSLGEAILWALTGRARDLDAAGRGTRAILADPSRATRVTVEIDGLGPVTRVTDGRQTTLDWGPPADGIGPVASGALGERQQQLFERLGASEDLLRVALDPWGALSLDHAEARALLLRLLRVEVDLGEALGAVAGARRVSADALDRIEAAAREQRLAAKRRLQALGTPREPERPAGPDPEALRAQLQALQAQAAAEQRRADRQAGRREALEARRAALARERDAVEAERRRQNVDGLRARREALRAEQASLAGALEGTDPSALDREIAERQQALRTIEAVVARLRQHEPARGCVIHGAVPCQTPGAAFGAALAELDQHAQQLRDRLAADQARLTTRRSQAARQRELDQEAAALEVALAHAEGLRARAEALERDLAALDHALAEEPPPPEPTPAAPRESLADALAGLEAALDAWRRYEVARARYEEQVAAVERARQEVEQLDRLCHALGPRGVRATALTEALEAFTASVNAHLGAWGYALAISPEPWQLVVNGRAVASLSKSERWRVSVALQLAMVAASGLGVAFVDEADGLDRANNAILAELVLRARIGSNGSPGQVIVAATRDPSDPLPQRPGLQAIRIDPRPDGTILRLDTGARPR